MVVACELRVQESKARVEMEEHMFQQNVRHREDMKALRKAHAVQ